MVNYVLQAENRIIQKNKKMFSWMISADIRIPPVSIVLIDVFGRLGTMGGGSECGWCGISAVSSKRTARWHRWLFVSFFIGCASIQNPNKVVNTDKNKIHRFSTDIRTLEINLSNVTRPTISSRLIPTTCSRQHELLYVPIVSNSNITQVYFLFIFEFIFRPKKWKTTREPPLGF